MGLSVQRIKEIKKEGSLKFKFLEDMCGCLYIEGREMTQ
jgi:hypothetical protein